MSRLPRPPIPIVVKLFVALRDLGDMPADKIVAHVETQRRNRRLGVRLSQVLQSLAAKLGCARDELRLDHEPPLGARAKIWKGGVVGGEIIGYVPAANDPDHLGYRPHATTFDGSHDTKTRIRGEHGQHSDIVRIKRQRRLERREAGKERPKAKISGGGLTCCVLGARCHCLSKRDYRRRRSRCGNWRPPKIQNRGRG